MPDTLDHLLKDIRDCRICEAELPHGCRPVLQVSAAARILVVGQAPGRRVHESGVPFDDPSGDRLRQWMGVTPQQFYDERLINIVPMGFCYPGTGKSGDLAPRKECAKSWRDDLMAQMPQVELTLVIGQYAINWHLGGRAMKTLTETVKEWQQYWPEKIVLPHPSPRNNIWLKKNPWFEKEVIPPLQERIAALL